jgi:undecaprenyl-diphosphatase
VILGATLLAGSWRIAAKREIPIAEARVFARVNGLPDRVWPVIWAPMQLGSFGGSLAACALLATRDRNRRIAISALLASQGAYWASKGVKRVVMRGRPAAVLAGVREREQTSGHGYLSGHSAVAFALATVAPSTPAFGAAAVVGFGRMYAGAHLPLDVVGGCGLGLLAGTTARTVAGTVRGSAST